MERKHNTEGFIESPSVGPLQSTQGTKNNHQQLTKQKTTPIN